MQVHSQKISGNFHYLYTFYTIKFRGGSKSGGARAPAEPASSAPMLIYKSIPKASGVFLSIVSRQSAANWGSSNNLACGKTIILIIL